VRRRLLVLLALTALAGCGGDDESDGSAPAATGPVATDICLGERGFGLRPAASGVSATTPGGAEFTVTFFPDEAAAAAAAGGSDGSTAVANAVVTPAGKRLTRQELAAVEECVRGGG
jgi:hypothetical protein